MFDVSYGLCCQTKVLTVKLYLDTNYVIRLSGYCCDIQMMLCFYIVITASFLFYLFICFQKQFLVKLLFYSDK